MKRPLFLAGCLAAFMLLCFASCDKNESPEPEPEEEIKLEGILSTLHRQHPRLLMTDERLAELKALSLSDGKLKEYAAEVVAQADKELFKSPIQHILIGPRLLDKSREALGRIYNLAFAYRWTGNEKYLSSAVANLKNVCSFPDWNPSHFLDVAEMSHAVAIGYDWLYQYMHQSERDVIRNGLIRLGLNEGQNAYNNNAWWVKVNHNWNQVCNSGMLIGALAVAETNPVLAAGLLNKAITNLPFALKVYGPDGAWGEGPGYWSYATDYTAYGISALQTALGDDFGLTDNPGLNVTGYFPMYTAGPTTLMLNYADAGEKSKLGAPHTLMWLANAYQNTHFSDFLHEQLATRNADAFDVIWYRPASGQTVPRELDKFFGGAVALWFSRGSWSDPNTIWVGIKAGYNKVNHAHLDLGNFEMDALGVRWARDLGSDDYNLPDYFGSKRYTYFRLNSLSHNVPIIGGKNQPETADSQFLKHRESVTEPFAVVELKEAYAEFCSSAQRGIRLMDNRKSVLVQDEFTLTKSAPVIWGMTTDATIRLVNDREAELTLTGQKLTARILSPAGAIFSVASAQQAAPQKTNTGVSRLLATVQGVPGSVTVSILLSPQWSATPTPVPDTLIPLSQW